MRRSCRLRVGLLFAAWLGCGEGVATGQEQANPLRFGELQIHSTPLSDGNRAPEPARPDWGSDEAGANQAALSAQGTFADAISGQMTGPPAGHEPAADMRQLPSPERVNAVRDPAVQPAGFDNSSPGSWTWNAIAADETESARPVADSGASPVPFRPRSAPRSSRQPFAGPAGLEVSGSVRQLAFATLVSLLGVVVIVVVTKAVRRQPGVARPASTAAPHVEQSLSLGNKSLLRVVRVGKQQVLVATDATGIRSMVAIPGEFSELVEEPAEEQVTPEQEQFFNHLMERLNSRPRPA
jgi:flagellar biogenesis protein FliO